MSVLAWGSNRNKELGFDQLEEGAELSSVPVLVNQLEGQGLVDISAGNGHTLVLNENGEVFAFGKGSDGQLGTGYRSGLFSNTAVQVKENGLGDCIVTRVVAGDGCSAAITNHGELFEWGFIHSPPGAHDVNSATNALPGLVEQARHRISDRLKALLRDSEFEYLMGDEAAQASSTEAEAGVLAVRTKRQRAFAPVRSSFPRKVRDVALGYGHCLVIVEGEESLWAKGYNDRGQLGVGTRVNEVEFVRVLGKLKDQPVKAIACGSAHNLAISSSGELYSWGSNVLGQLGLSAGVADQLSPARVRLESSGDGDEEEELALQVCCGSYHSVVLGERRTLFSFGHAEYGQHGSLQVNEAHGDFRHLSRHFFTPQRVWRFHQADVVLEQIYVGQQFNAALDVKGQVWTWGFGAAGNLGHGKKQRSTAPQVIEGLVGKRILKLCTGHTHMLVLTLPEGDPFALKNARLLSEENSGGSYDVHLYSQNGTNGQACHLAMVACRCPALLQYLTDDRILLPVATERLVIRALLEFLYCDVVRTCPPHRLKDLQLLASKLGLPRLGAICQLQRYQRHVLEGFLLPDTIEITSSSQVPESTFAKDMLALLKVPMNFDVRLAAGDYNPDQQQRVLPPGHTRFTWTHNAHLALPQGHTNFSWVGEEESNRAQVFNVHKFAFHSYPFFVVLLSGNFKESEIVKQGGVVKLASLPNADVLRGLLQWIYSGSVAEGGIHEDNVAELVQAAQALGVADLARACERFLLQVLHEDNAQDILQIANDHFLTKLARECELRMKQPTS
ncbi:hypothetical protein BASA81_003672 [Batrachochytrium salamandrivorans]|nr:hypothetical protein BASA81_003672 [Batrachochytrium salamandrivorans]